MSTFGLVCLILSLVLYSAYVIIMYVKYKPSCLSETYYLAKNGNLFTIWLLLVSFLIFPAWLEISPISFQFLPFLSVVSLGIIGLSPKYLSSDRRTHIISTIAAVILSLTWSIVTGMYIIPLILGIILIILCFMSAKNKLFWTENLAFSNIYLSILLS